MTSNEVPVRRGRRRSAAADQAILAAALEVLRRDGYGGFTMGAVIKRSGTSSATVYRRWPTKQDLVAAAIGTLSQEIPEIDTGSLDGDIAAFVRAIAEFDCIGPEDIGVDVVSELGRNAEFNAEVMEKFVGPRVAALKEIMRRARHRGELGTGGSPSVAYGFVIGPILHRAQVQADSATPTFLKSVAVGSTAAIRALAPSGTGRPQGPDAVTTR